MKVSFLSLRLLSDLKLHNRDVSGSGEGWNFLPILFLGKTIF